MAYSNSRQQRVYLLPEATLGTVPNTAGAANFAGANACRITKFNIRNNVATIRRPDKTGTRSLTQGVTGKRTASWESDMAVAPNGTVAIKPDCDPILTAGFGQSPTVIVASVKSITAISAATPAVCTCAAHGLGATGAYMPITITAAANALYLGSWIALVIDASTFSLVGSTAAMGASASASAQVGSVVYTLSDTVLSFAALNARQPWTVFQEIAAGCVVGSMNFSLNQDMATWTASGTAKAAIDSVNFSSLDTTGQSGLAAFPGSEPASPVTNGNAVSGFLGQLVIDGNIMGTLKSMGIKVGINSGLDFAFGSYYATLPSGATRVVSANVSLFEQDDAASSNIYTKALTKAPVVVVGRIGNTSGSMMAIVLKGVQMEFPDQDDSSNRWVMTIGDSTATASTLVALDEVTLMFF